MMNIILRSSNTIYCTCSLPMDIFNDEKVKIVLHMASNVINYRCIPIFVTASPRVRNWDVEPFVKTETSFRANVSAPNIEEEVLPQIMSLQQRYFSLHDSNDTINDNGIMPMDVEEEVLPLTTSLDQRYFPFHNNDFRNNDNPIYYCWWFSNSIAIDANVQVYTTSNKVMIIQDRLHGDGFY